MCLLVVPDLYLSYAVLARISKGALVNSIQSVQVLLEVIRHIKNQHPDVHPLVELAADMTIVRKPDWRSLLDTSFAHLFSVKPATDSVADVVEFWARILAVIFHCAAGSDSVMPCDECRDGHGMFNTCRVRDDSQSSSCSNCLSHGLRCSFNTSGG